LDETPSWDIEYIALLEEIIQVADMDFLRNRDLVLAADHH
jgi:hypothetical protein